MSIMGLGGAFTCVFNTDYISLFAGLCIGTTNNTGECSREKIVYLHFCYLLNITLQLIDGFRIEHYHSARSYNFSFPRNPADKIVETLKTALLPENYSLILKLYFLSKDYTSISKLHPSTLRRAWKA